MRCVWCCVCLKSGNCNVLIYTNTAVTVFFLYPGLENGQTKFDADSYVCMQVFNITVQLYHFPVFNGLKYTSKREQIASRQQHFYQLRNPNHVKLIYDSK